MNDLDALVSTVLASPKQRAITPDLVRWLGERELAKGRSLKEAVKATKNKLHQLAGAYQGERPDYTSWLARLGEAIAQGKDVRPLCTQIMAQHASTRERLSVLSHFYTTIFAGLPPVASVLDLACGLNPLAIPWMGLPPGAIYHACDIYSDQVDFLAAAMPLFGVSGDAFVCNLLAGAPPVSADVALLLKTIPCLEQADKNVGLRLVEAIDAPVVIVSFPARSLGGRSKGMAVNYAAHFAELMQGKAWRSKQVDFSGELVFRVEK
jgi:16S rRNA (guanine(1405)-N(7))-methyltransferase